MINSISAWLCQVLGCKSDYDMCMAALKESQATAEELQRRLDIAKEAIKNLELVKAHPAPPVITNVVERDSTWIQQVIDGLKLNIVREPLGDVFMLTNQRNFMEIIAWDWIDSVKYGGAFKCGNFSIAFKAHVDEYFRLNQVGIVLDYSTGHAYNIVIFPEGKVMLLEPQRDALFTWGTNQVFYGLKDSVVVI